MPGTADSVPRPGIRLALVCAVLPAITTCDAGPPIVPGVSWDLARMRASRVHDVRYDLAFTIPERRDLPVEGTMTATFVLASADRPVVFDFNAPAGSVHEVRVGGTVAPAEVRDGHVIIDPSRVRAGTNDVTFRFTAGDGALNRSDEFLYTLFVPDRASTAFPCFDQPDIKATYRLTLALPPGWIGVSNGAAAAVDTTDAGTSVRFHATAPLSTYLFAFVAGRFQVETGIRDGRVMHFYHRETDTARVRRNRDAVFDLHATALQWLTEYTGRPYPFPGPDQTDKFDFVAVPSFQYGGMEHAGAILYRAGSLLLDEDPTQSQLLGRASLIAHETAHMWFGDLVTMRWFDDVWMKEVFANFMAAKIVDPAFPDVDHELRFFLAHYPAAYGVDRTQGANPIRQHLDNLLDAGTLYGAAIYQKAPIVMRQLERLVGADTLRSGLQEYLRRYRYGNASWSDLIAILDERTPVDLAAWSRVWVEAPGRPALAATVDTAPDGRVRGIRCTQADPFGRGLLWEQDAEVVVGYGANGTRMPVRLDRAVVTVPGAEGLPTPEWVLPGGTVGYGGVALDAASRTALATHAAAIPDPTLRSAAWMALWESVLDGTLPPPEHLEAVLRALPGEEDQQIVQQLVGMASASFWRLLDQTERRRFAARIDTTIWQQIQRRANPGLKAALFGAYADLATTPDAVRRLERLWRGQETIDGLAMTEERLTSLAEELALRAVPDGNAMLETQRDRIANPDRRRRFAFVLPALSADQAVRDSVFESFRDPSNREREPWTLSALRFLNHPLRSPTSERYIRPSLELLEEIQRTGDIFFPLQWLDAVLGGHQSPAAADAVVAFLREHPTLPPRLAGKVLQAADPLFRAASVVHGWDGGRAVATLGRTMVRGER